MEYSYGGQVCWTTKIAHENRLRQEKCRRIDRLGIYVPAHRTKLIQTCIVILPPKILINNARDTLPVGKISKYLWIFHFLWRDLPGDKRERRHFPNTHKMILFIISRARWDQQQHGNAKH